MSRDNQDTEQVISRRKVLKYIGSGMALTMTGTLSQVAGNTRSNERYNVILVLPDQLQADRLHCYGNACQTSPNIDKLARKGIRFTNFYSVAPWTAPSFGSLVTGRYPSVAGSTLFKVSKEPLVDPKLPKFPEIFQEAGYRTVAFINNGVAGSQITRPGFDEYYERQDVIHAKNVVERDESQSLLTAPETTVDIKKWLDQHQNEPFFMMINYFEPHSLYNPPPEHDLFKTDAYPQATDTGYGWHKGHMRVLGKLEDQKAIERLHQLYDGKIHFVDKYIGDLYRHLEKLKLDKKTLFIISSDHGELVYSHPEDFLTSDHVSLYDSVLHIPFIAAGPGIPAGKTIDALAFNLDTAVTVLEYAGLPSLPGAQGKSLLSLIKGKTALLHEIIYSEMDMGVPLRAVRTLQYKLILNLWTCEKQLFDLKADPGEKNNIYWQQRAIAKPLEKQLEKFMRENELTADARRKRLEWYSGNEIAEAMAPNGGLLLTGVGWHYDDDASHGHWDGGCFWTEAGDGTRTAVLRASGAKVGRFNLYIHYGNLPGVKLATNAPLTVVTAEATYPTTVNFAEGAGQWHLLGTYTDPRWVTMNNLADGAIVVDAIKFEGV